MDKIIRHTVTSTITETWSIIWTGNVQAGEALQRQTTISVQNQIKTQEESNELLQAALTTAESGRPRTRDVMATPPVPTALDAQPDGLNAKPSAGSQRKRGRRAQSTKQHSIDLSKLGDYCMGNKRIFTLFLVIGLLAVLTTTAYATSNAHPATPSLVGTWKMTIPKTATSPETNETMQTFFADGNYLETNNNPKSGSLGHGVWIGSGTTYLYSFQVFTFDEQGKYNGKRIIHVTIHMDGPDHYKGHGSADIIDAAGKVTKNVFSADTEATRMEVELP